jgi:hypothetical protein
MIGEKANHVPQRADRKAVQCPKVAGPMLATAKIVRGPRPATKVTGVVPKGAPLRKAAEAMLAVPAVPGFRPALALPAVRVVAVPKVAAVRIAKARRGSATGTAP